MCRKAAKIRIKEEDKFLCAELRVTSFALATPSTAIALKAGADYVTDFEIFHFLSNLSDLPNYLMSCANRVSWDLPPFMSCMHII